MARREAMAQPMPRLAPVIMAVRPAREGVCWDKGKEGKELDDVDSRAMPLAILRVVETAVILLGHHMGIAALRLSRMGSMSK